MPRKTVEQIEAEALERRKHHKPLQRKLTEAEKAAERAKQLREEREARRASLTPVQRRREDTALTPSKNTDLGYIYSLLALCGLPYKRTSDSKWVKVYGNMALAITPGTIGNPLVPGEFKATQIPYGSKARALMLHLTDSAVRNNSNVVELGRSLSGFIRGMGFDVTGGANGSIRGFKQQLSNILGCHMQFTMWRDKADMQTVKCDPVSDFRLWLPEDVDQQSLWESQITLDPRFYTALKAHALPINMRLYSAVRNSPRQMDILLWLTYRAKDLKEPYFLRWDILKDQFCTGSRIPMRSFQRDFKGDLQCLEELLGRDLPLKLDERGVWLVPKPKSRLWMRDL